MSLRDNKEALIAAADLTDLVGNVLKLAISKAQDADQRITSVTEGLDSDSAALLRSRAGAIVEQLKLQLRAASELSAEIVKYVERLGK